MMEQENLGLPWGFTLPGDLIRLLMDKWHGMNCPAKSMCGNQVPQPAHRIMTSGGRTSTTGTRTSTSECRS